MASTNLFPHSGGGCGGGIHVPSFPSLHANSNLTNFSARDYYLEQVEKWKKIHSTHNADKIVLHQLEQPKTDNDAISALLTSNQGSNKPSELQSLLIDQHRLLKAHLVEELESSDWMFSATNQNIGKANSMWTAR